MGYTEVNTRMFCRYLLICGCVTEDVLNSTGELGTKQVYIGRYSRNRALRFGCACTVPLRKQTCQQDLSDLKRLALFIISNRRSKYFVPFLTIFPAPPIDAARSIVCTNQIMMDVRCVMACGDCGYHSGSMVIILGD